MVIRATEFVAAMKLGDTKPLLFKCDDGNRYVVKLMSNPEGIRALPHELLAYRLGRLLDLPIASGRVVHISQEVIDACPPMSHVVLQPGPHYGSYYYEHAVSGYSLDHAELAKCVNLDKVRDMIVFDHWVNNADRRNNSSNILIIKEAEYRLLFIDHADCFYEIDRSRTKVNVYWGPTYRAFVPFIDDDDPFRSALRSVESLSRTDIEEALSLDLPSEWGVSAAEIQALIEVLRRRQQLLAAAIRQLQGHFPQWRKARERGK